MSDEALECSSHRIPHGTLWWRPKDRDTERTTTPEASERAPKVISTTDRVNVRMSARAHKSKSRPQQPKHQNNRPLPSQCMGLQTITVYTPSAMHNVAVLTVQSPLKHTCMTVRAKLTNKGRSTIKELRKACARAHGDRGPSGVRN